LLHKLTTRINSRQFYFTADYFLLGGIALCSSSDSNYCWTFLRNVVCLSLPGCRLSHSCTLLKPFDV